MEFSDYTFEPLTSAMHDVSEIKKEYGRQQGIRAVENLKKNFFNAVYADNIDEARSVILDLISDGAVIGCGDSHTLFALNLDPELGEKGCTVIPHTHALNVHSQESPDWGYVKQGTREDMLEILRHYLVADVFMLGANAISMDGQIVNIDGVGNRVAGSLYGAEKIIMVAGVNKLEKDLDSAISRARYVAAHMNNIKYGEKMPCTVTGVCADCKSRRRCCNVTAVYHKAPIESEFYVVIINEDLGF